jgi:hypothetical protein
MTLRLVGEWRYSSTYSARAGLNVMEKKRSLDPAGNRTHIPLSPVRSLVTTLTELSRQNAFLINHEHIYLKIS